MPVSEATNERSTVGAQLCLHRVGPTRATHPSLIATAVRGELESPNAEPKRIYGSIGHGSIRNHCRYIQT